VPYTPVVSPLCLRIEETRRKLAVPPVIMKTLTALILSCTRLICAIAILLVLFAYALHPKPPSENSINILIHFTYKNPL
jgi:hypothetical protein